MRQTGPDSSPSTGLRAATNRGHAVDWLYEESEDRTARFVLGPTGENPLFCIGVNPSTAKPGNLDKTMATVQAVALRHGFDSFVMLNIYPFRSTDPNGLPRHFDSALDSLNQSHFAKALANGDHAVWAAWGALVKKRSYLVPALLDLLDLPELANARWLCRGRLSKDGHPHHPLYVKGMEPLVPFEIRAYRDALRAAAAAKPLE